MCDSQPLRESKSQEMSIRPDTLAVDPALIPEVLSESDSCSEGRLLSKQDSTLVYLVSASFWSEAEFWEPGPGEEHAYPREAPRHLLCCRDCAPGGHHCRRHEVRSPGLTLLLRSVSLFLKVDRAQFLAPKGPSEIYLLEQKITPVTMHTGVSRALAPAGSPPWAGKDCGPRVELPGTGEFWGPGCAQMVLRGCDDQGGPGQGPGTRVHIGRRLRCPMFQSLPTTHPDLPACLFLP